MVYKQFLTKYSYLLRNSCGVLWDNHETAGEYIGEYCFLHSSYICYSENITQGCVAYKLIESPPVFADLIILLKDLCPSITALDYQHALSLYSEHTQKLDYTINGEVYRSIKLHQLIDIEMLFNFLKIRNYIKD